MAGPQQQNTSSLVVDADDFSEKLFSIPERYRLVRTVGHLRMDHGDPCYRREGQRFWRASRTPEGPASFSLEEGRKQVRLRAYGSGAPWVISQGERILGLDDHPEDFQPQDKKIVGLIKRAPEARFGTAPNVLEVLLPAILGQRVTHEEAARSYRSIVRRYGEDAPSPVSLRLIPEPKKLARVPLAEFVSMGVEAKRARTIIEAAKQAKKVEEVRDMPRKEALKRLRALSGVGIWTAEVTQHSLGDPDAIAVGDFHLKNVVAYALTGQARGTDEEMVALLKPYKGHRARVVSALHSLGISPPKFAPKRRVFRPGIDG